MVNGNPGVERGVVMGDATNIDRCRARAPLADARGSYGDCNTPYARAEDKKCAA